MLTVLSANGPSGYRIANSLRFRSSASAYLSRTPTVAGNRKTWTWSGWIKRGILSSTSFLEFFTVGTVLNESNYFAITFYQDCLHMGTGAANLRISSSVYRDTSAWYHFVIAVDTTQSTAANRVRAYVNGIEITAFSSNNAPTLNVDTAVNSTITHNIGRNSYNSSDYFDGYLADVNFIDGQALDPTAFGAFDPITGVWTPKKYAGSYGTNGFHLNFSNGTSTTTLGYDSSGNGNNWTTNNISLTAGSTYDWMIDSPTPYQGSSYGVGNYCVFNPVYASYGAYLSNGNLTLTSNDANYRAAYSTIGMTSGSWYAEFYVGLRNADMGISVANLNNGIGYYYLYTGAKWDTSTSSTAYGASYTTGDTIGVAFDATNLTLTFYKNGVSQGVAFTGMTSGTYQFVVYSQGAGANLSFNAGQRPFAYTPPSGYKSLCTYNLPTPTIQNGAGYMAATTYTGNGATQSISNAVNGVSFQPDFVWVKSRSSAGNHSETDSVRGVNKQLFTNLTDAEGSQTDQVTALNSNGFALGANAAGTGSVNVNGVTYVAWQWKAGGTAVTNTAGSITSSVSANTTSGFSVVTYTGTGANATVGHGLGVAPSMVIVKNRSVTTNWGVYHISLGASDTQYMLLNTTGAINQAGALALWNNTAPTSSLLSLGTQQTTNASANTFVAYCFAAIPGYSAFGSYTGNGSTDGPFVYCGFRPKFLLVKRTDAVGDWAIHDSSRVGYNANVYELYPNLSSAEQGATGFDRNDFLANGFKMRSTAAGLNASGGTYIYAAFAENPFQNALAR